jgi:hypothetical protein
MNRTGVLSLLFLSVTSSALAQQSIKPESSKNTSLTHLHAAGADCPIDLKASRGARVPISVPASNLIPSTTLEFQVHLTILNLRARDIVNAQVTAHGFSDKWKAIDLKNSSQTPDLAKTLDVALDLKGMGRAFSELSLSHFTAVTAIDLESITYRDGTKWYASSPGACRITPDLIMLVGAAQAVAGTSKGN